MHFKIYFKQVDPSKSYSSGPLILPGFYFEGRASLSECHCANFSPRRNADHATQYRTQKKHTNISAKQTSGLLLSMSAQTRACHARTWAFLFVFVFLSGTASSPAFDDVGFFWVKSQGCCPDMRRTQPAAK